MGLEIVIDLDTISHGLPGAWTDCGIDIWEVLQCLSRTRGSYLANVAASWDQLAREMEEHIRDADLSVEVYRFRLLQLLWTLKAGRQRDISIQPFYLTLGQRAVVMRAEELLTRDLHQRYVISAAPFLIKGKGKENEETI